jgi:hypothetical protein
MFIYILTLPLCLDLEGGKHFFNTVKEGDSVLFATEDEQEAHNWVMAFYRATGQAHKPTPPVTTGKNSVVTKVQGGIVIFLFLSFFLFSLRAGMSQHCNKSFDYF